MSAIRPTSYPMIETTSKWILDMILAGSQALLPDSPLEALLASSRISDQNSGYIYAFPTVMPESSMV